MKTYDVIIIGAGPAGLTAALYSARYKLDTLVIGKLFGGLAGEAYEICNFPSYERISGTELMKRFLDHARSLGVELRAGEVIEIEKEKEGFLIKTSKSEYAARKVILAMGSERRRLQLENEKKFMGRGITYCATCDAAFYKDKVVGVVGGRNAAIMAADLLSQYAKKVYIIYRGKDFSKAEPAWLERLKKRENVVFMTNSIVTKLIGKDRLEKIEINSERELELDGLFIEIGNVPNVELAKKLGVELEGEYIVVDRNQRTNVEGVFAAGDITHNPLKQIITACAEGAIAANSAYEELRREKVL